MNRAHELCDGAYRIVERYAGRDGTALAAGGPRGQTWYRSHERKMLVTCAR